MNKRKIEIFTAGCPVCSPVVDMVKSLASGENEVVVYNLVEQCDSGECIRKVEQYGVKSLPAVAVDGALLAICKERSITKEDLFAAGIGVNA